MLGLLYVTDPGLVLGERPSSGLTCVRSQLSTLDRQRQNDTDVRSIGHFDSEDKHTGISNNDIKTDIDSNTDVACRVQQTIAKINAMRQNPDTYNATGVFPSFAAFRTNKTSTIEDVSKAASENDILTTTNNNKHDKKKTLEQIVTEALAVAKTPEDVARYLLSHSHNSKEKTIDSATIVTERHAKSSNSIKTEIVPRPEVAYPSVFPPITSFDFEGIMSAASSVTQQSRCTVNEDSTAKDIVSGSILGSLKLDNYIDIASLGTERNSQSFNGVSITENSGQLPIFIRDNDKPTLKESVSGKPPLSQARIIKPISDARTVNAGLSVSPVRSIVKKTTTKKQQKKSIRSLGPSFFKALDTSDGSTVESSNTSVSPIPEDIVQPKSTNANCEDNADTVNSVSTGFSKSKICNLPPRIPLRGVKSANQIKPINTSTDEDGSVECSIIKEDDDTTRNQLTQDGNFVVLDSVAISTEKEEKVVTPPETNRVAHINQKTVTFSSFDEWHTWEADEPVVNGAPASSGSVIGEVVNTSTLRNVKLKKILSFRNVAEKKNDDDVNLYSSVPVQQLDVVPNSMECDISLLSNELEGSKLKIWDEDESVESRITDTNILTKTCMTVVDINRRCESSAEEFIFPLASSGMTCTDGVSDTERKRSVRWTSSAATDDDDDSDDDNEDDDTSIGDAEHSSRFSCGTETQRIKEDLRDLGHQTGMTHAVRRLLGSYDITCDELQLDDQPLWRNSKSSPQRQKSKSKQKYCGDEVGTPTSITVTDKQKLFLVKLKALATNSGGVKHSDENMDKPKTAIDKRKLYVEKLKELSLRHV